jgi:thymidylate kinase
MLDKCKELFDLWNRNSLIYCHWKSNEHLMDGLNGETDLDVLLNRDDKECGCTILREIDFIKYKSPFGFCYPNVEDWIGFDNSTGILIHLHLHYALVTGHTGLKEYELPWTEECLQTRIQNKETGVYITDPNLELISLYTRLILKSDNKWLREARVGKYHINKHFLKEIDFIKKDVEWVKVEEIAKRYFGQESEMFCTILKSEVLTSPLYIKLYNIVNDRMRGIARYKGITLSMLKHYYSLAVLVRRLLRKRFNVLLITRKVTVPPMGLSVAFIGQDGSGKSTITEDINKWLFWKIESQRFYLGSGDHYNSLPKRVLAHLSKLRKELTKDIKSQRTIRETSTGKKNKWNVKNMILSLIVAHNNVSVARRAYRELTRAEKYKRKGGIPLFDRFPQSQFTGIYDGPKIRDSYERNGLDYTIVKWMARREEQYLAKTQKYYPDIVFKLILPPEESIKRKPFEDLAIVTIKSKITKELAFPNSIIYEVDATQDYNQEILYIKNRIWEAILQNH